MNIKWQIITNFIKEKHMKLNSNAELKQLTKRAGQSIVKSKVQAQYDKGLNRALASISTAYLAGSTTASVATKLMQKTVGKALITKLNMLGYSTEPVGEVGKGHSLYPQTMANLFPYSSIIIYLPNNSKISL